MAILRTQTTCPPCVESLAKIELEAWRAEELRWLPDLVSDRLRYGGFREIELSASTHKVPVAIRRALPKTDVQQLIGGVALDTSFAGFGLCGGQGIGKTMCLAAIIRERVEASLRAKLAVITEMPDLSQGPWHDVAPFRWVNWPESAAAMKSIVMADKGAQMVERLVHQFSVVSLLVLDDLGRERLAKAYDEDYAAGMLDRIIDVRSREQRAILWTSNLTPANLAKRYGGALASRLLGASPAIELRHASDLRLQKSG